MKAYKPSDAFAEDYKNTLKADCEGCIDEYDCDNEVCPMNDDLKCPLEPSCLEKHRSTYLFHKRRDNLIKHFGNKCSKCGSNYLLEFHFKENGSGKAQGGWQHLITIEKAIIENIPIDLLCRECHFKAHEIK